MPPAELRAIIATLGLTQTRVAQLLGVNDATLRRWLMASEINASRDIPEPVARVMRAAGAGKLKLETLAKFASPSH